jgi:2-polyprenyl-3-methyl-5-hydroxy-6-metoxy-1,4-benzoquinol methylase
MDVTKIGLQSYYPNGQPTETLYSNGVLKETLFKIIKTKDKTILDVGCGNGRLNTLMMDAKEIVGIDLVNRIDKRFDLPQFSFIEFGIFQIHQKPGYFDIVIFMGTFYLHYNYHGYTETLSRAKELINPSGQIVILDDTKRFHNKVECDGFYDINQLCDYCDLKIVNVLKPNFKYHIYILENV